MGNYVDPKKLICDLLSEDPVTAENAYTRFVETANERTILLLLDLLCDQDLSGEGYDEYIEALLHSVRAKAIPILIDNVTMCEQVCYLLVKLDSSTILDLLESEEQDVLAMVEEYVSEFNGNEYGLTDIIISALSSEKSTVKLNATYLSRYFVHQDIVEFLFKSLSDVDPKIRRTSALSLAHLVDIGTEDCDEAGEVHGFDYRGEIAKVEDGLVFKRLRRLLRNSNPYILIAAHLCLAKLGYTKSVKHIQSALTCDDSQVRTDAIWALAQLGDIHSIEKIFGMIKDTARSVQLAAIEAIYDLGVTSSQIFDLVACNYKGEVYNELMINIESINAVRDEVDDVEAADYCERLFGNSILQTEEMRVDLLNKLSSYRKPSELMEVVETLGRIREVRAIPELVRILCDQDIYYDIRKVAFWSLGQFGREVVPQLIEIFHLTDDRIRESIVYFLRDVGKDEEAFVLVPLVNDENRYIRSAVFKALSKLWGVNAIPHLLTGLNDKDWYVRCAICDAMATIHDETVISALSKTLHDPDKQVRRAALSALQTLKHMEKPSEEDWLNR